jgi:catechol 2,3-dioxygenase-like lactoylglutathione lyase family enzyme
VEQPFVVHEVDHVVLRCVDPARMERFYVDVLGLAVERRIDGLGLVQLRAGRSLVDIVPGRVSERGEPNLDHVCLGIDAADLARVEAYLADRAVEVVAGPMEVYGARGIGTSLYVHDPERNTVELKLRGEIAHV